MSWQDKPCKVWTGSQNGSGYGERRINWKKYYVHRLAWEEANGPIPDGMFVLHHCDNPACYEPTHLFLGTHQDNMADMAAKGRGKTRNLQITHCPHGHEYTPENTYINPHDGTRNCRICGIERVRARRAKIKAGVAQ